MLIKILLLSCIYMTLQASNILTDYRKHGLDGIEKRMDLALTDKEYWDTIVKNKDTSFGYFESYNAILTCNKSKSNLKLFKKNKNKFTLIEEYNAFTGKAKGDKVREGDLKTPIGIYNLEKKISKLDSFYGPLAFVTNYPNIYDLYLGKNGSGIWIHGLPTKQKRDDYTKGCIAINNDNIVCLDKEINIDNTLLIIHPNKQNEKITKDQLSTILSQLFEWRYSWIYNDINTYLSFYSKNFKRFDGMNYERFKQYKTRIFNKQEQKTIIFNDINIIPYPNLDNTFYLTFKEYYKSDSFKFEGYKTLILKLNDKDKLEIITEK